MEWNDILEQRAAIAWDAEVSHARDMAEALYSEGASVAFGICKHYAPAAVAIHRDGKIERFGCEDCAPAADFDDGPQDNLYWEVFGEEDIPSDGEIFLAAVEAL